MTSRRTSLKPRNRPRTAAPLGTERSLSWMSVRPCVSAPAKPAKPRFEPKRGNDDNFQENPERDRDARRSGAHRHACRSEEHTSELQSLMRISYAVFCLKKNNKTTKTYTHHVIRPPTILHHN